MQVPDLGPLGHPDHLRVLPAQSTRRPVSPRRSSSGNAVPECSGGPFSSGHGVPFHVAATSSPLNEGRGVNPGDTRQRPRSPTGPACPLNEGRGVNPGDTSTDSTFARRFTSLNEGRGVNPGDTGSHGVVPHEYAVLALNEGRGVNPGDTPESTIVKRRAITAQRRPGREPRRHGHRLAHARHGRGSLNEGRGVNPGDTPARPERLPPPTGPLNEGRGVNPGDTPQLPIDRVRHDPRSTKAGA